MRHSIRLWVAAAVLAVGAAVPAGVRADDDAVAAAVKVIRDPAASDEAKGTAFSALMDLGERAAPAVPALVEALRSQKEILRDYAVTTLSKIGPAAKNALPALREIQRSDPSQDIRSLAADAVAAIGRGGGGGEGAPPGGGSKFAPAGPAPAPDAPPPTPEGAPYPPAPQQPRPHAHGPSVAPDPNAFLELLPDLRQAPAPAWVHPGTRLVYYAAAASVAGMGTDFKLDENGDWVTADGRRVGGSPKQGGGSGHGLTQVDVVFLSDAQSVLAVTSWGFTPEGSPRLIGDASGVGIPGAGGDWWLSPAVLQRVPERNGADLKILRGPYSARGKQFQALWFWSGNAQGNQVHVYDLASGVLLHAGSSTDQAAAQFVDPNAPVSATRLLTTTTVVDVRDVAVPWADDPAPDWLATLGTLGWAGAYAVVIPNVPVYQQGLSVRLTANDRGPGWARFTTDIVLQNSMGLPPTTQQTVRVAGPAQLGGLYVPPAAFARLTPGQVLDRDPDTKYSFSVGQAANVDGRPAVTFVGEGPLLRVDLAYDRATGLQVYAKTTDRSLNIVSEVKLAR